MKTKSWLLLSASVAALGCQNDPAPPSPNPATPGPSSPQPAAAASTAAPTSSAAAAPPPPFPMVVPAKVDDVAKVINPRKEEPYKGPTARVIGTVKIKGDPPPSWGYQYPTGKCGEAAATHEKLFRVGLEGALADALV